MIRDSVFAGLAVVALVSAGCGVQTGSAPTAAPIVVSTGAAAARGGAHTVPGQLDFMAKTVDGQGFSGQSLAGKPVALWFWAPWCPACQREAPMVARAAEANPGVTFVGVAALSQVPAMQDFIEKYSAGEFTQLADTSGMVWAKFGVTQQPAFAFVKPGGQVEVVRGTLSEGELTKRLAGLSDS